MKDREKTQEEIAAEIVRLKEIAASPKFRRTTAFGDSNVDAIKAQIFVLEFGLSELAAYDKYEDDDDPDSSQHVVDHAIEAVAWRNGDALFEGESLADSWEGLY